MVGHPEAAQNPEIEALEVGMKVHIEGRLPLPLSQLWEYTVEVRAPVKKESPGPAVGCYLFPLVSAPAAAGPPGLLQPLAPQGFLH